MKRHIVLIAAMSLLAAPLYASDASSPANQQAAASTAGKAASDRQLEQAQAIVARMQKQMKEIWQTKDPGKRRKLLREHWQTMQEGMNVMRGMGSGMMIGSDMQGGGMQGGAGMMGGGNMGSGANGMMEMRLEMMTEMMEQMMQREQVYDAMPHR